MTEIEERNRRLADANRQLLLKLHEANRKIQLAKRMVELLDYSKHEAIINEWRDLE